MSNKPLSPQQRKFCQNYAKGMSATQAYIKAGYMAKGNAAEVSASRLLSNDKVSEYIESLTQKAEDAALLSIKEKREYLARAVRTPHEEVDESSDLCTGKTYSKQGDKIIHRVDPVRAMQEDSKLAGHYQAEKHEHSFSSIGDLIDEIKDGK